MRSLAFLLASAVVAGGSFCLSGPLAEGPLPQDFLIEEDRSCKPSGPLRLVCVPTRLADGSVELAIEVEPLLEMTRVEWQLELPLGIELLEEQPRGVVRGSRNEVTSLRRRVSVANAPSTGHIRLVASGVFLGADETGARFEEPVSVERTLHWGEPASPGTPSSYFDRASGEVVQGADMPSTHRVGR